MANEGKACESKDLVGWVLRSSVNLHTPVSTAFQYSKFKILSENNSL